MKRLGLFGGTFNPIHYGHLHAASCAREAFSLNQVVFIPTGSPPHKEKTELANSYHRYIMTLLATANNGAFVVSDLELKRGGVSYSIETIREIKDAHGPKSKIYFIVGADVILELQTWKDIDDLVKICKFIGINRVGFKLKTNTKYSSHIHLLNVPSFPISSTQIRERIKENRSIKYLLPELVEEYIYAHRLYK